LSDTVGFIRKLPHHLVESFKSTLDEVRESDLLLHVVDIAHPRYEDQIRTVQKTLNDLGAGEKPTILILNKVDLYREKYFDAYLDDKTRIEIETELWENLGHEFEYENIYISAVTKENVNNLRALLKERIQALYEERYPYQVKRW